MTQFHEGQEVEVLGGVLGWPRKAKIVGPISDRSIMVEFPDGCRAVFDAGHIMATDFDLGDEVGRINP